MKLVFIENMKRGMVSAEDIFPPGNRAVPYVRAGTVLTGQMIREMERLGIHTAYIKDAPVSAPPAALPPIPKPRPIIRPQLKAEAVTTLEDFFSAAQLGADAVHSSAQIVKHLDTVVGQLVDSLTGHSDVLININDLKSYDEYTFHHSLSVAVLAIAIGQYMDFGRDELSRIGMSAMMHDIGKTAVPIEIIHKTSRLDDAEFQVVKGHSPAGYDYLVKAGIGDEDMWRTVLHHHEKSDGTGYPHGLQGDEIPLHSRIISVGDVYDALTSNRPYRTPMQPAEAIEYIMGGTGTAFDYDTVYAFVKKVELYPVSSRIQLSNGAVATVVSNENPMRPLVRLDNGEYLDLYRDRGCLSLVITRLM